MSEKYPNFIERLSIKFISWIGTPSSLFIHSLIFGSALSLMFLGFEAERILLFLTTAVSLEAIYLSIFIQMSINRNSKVLDEVSEDVGELHEEVLED